MDTETDPAGGPGAEEPPLTEPSSAERARSILATAWSLSLEVAGHRLEPVALRAADGCGLLLHGLPATDVPAEVAAALAAARGDGLDAVAELTDVAPTPVRDRVRARLALRGRLGIAEGSGLGLRPAWAVLDEGGLAREIDPGELSLAAPDPLAACEAGMLAHLDTAHADAVARLTRLVEPRLLLGVVCVRPVRLDRFGLVLRVEHARRHHDVRLAFAAPALRPRQAGCQIRLLLARAAACPRHRLTRRP
ncbi:DUF2470 domain-containing protein [Streptomyces shenzhenensis]|uniref:DUF2470 domain-containing protein n=1 Tax=Streptomyces shenzhenensis TaxID=943815 RepID=UPI0038143A76